MPTAPVFDLRLHYEALGPPDAATLLLVHGSGGTGREWEPLLDGLAERFHVLLPDCRGHGQTLDPRNDYRFRTLAADLAEFLRVLARAPAHVVGHSNGGNVALVMCAEHPQAVGSSFFLSP